ncbi:MAG: TIGR01459 family HAD-type hydrolase, partial [Caulobacteraceae bacterium]|nr:TIGR01459 family HAD-type hydrolase [Caulobacteraceae bacterium]
LFIAGGIHGAEATAAGELDAGALETLLAREGVSCRYVMATLA